MKERLPSSIFARCFVLLLALVFSSVLLLAQQPASGRINIAVLDFDAREGFGRGEAAALSDVFCARLVETNRFVVVDRNRIKSILEEQGFQRSESCSSVECAVQVGKILKVEKIFAGVIGKIGQLYNVNIQMIDVATAQIQINKNRQHEGDIEELATDVVPEIASEMIKELTGSEAPEEEYVSKAPARHELILGVGSGASSGKDLFVVNEDSKLHPKTVFTLGYIYNFSSHLAAGIRLSGFAQSFNDPQSGGATLQFTSNTLSVDGRWVFSRGGFEPYGSLILAYASGTMKGEQLGKISYGGASAGICLGGRIPLFSHVVLSLEIRATGGSAKWRGGIPFYFVGDIIETSYTAAFLVLSYEWGRV